MLIAHGAAVVGQGCVLSTGLLQQDLGLHSPLTTPGPGIKAPLLGVTASPVTQHRLFHIYINSSIYIYLNTFLGHLICLDKKYS